MPLEAPVTSASGLCISVVIVDLDYPRPVAENGGIGKRKSGITATLSSQRQGSDHGQGSRLIREERRAVRGPSQEGHEQVSRCCDRKQRGLVEPRRQELGQQPEPQEQRQRQRRQ